MQKAREVCEYLKAKHVDNPAIVSQGSRVTFRSPVTDPSVHSQQSSDQNHQISQLQTRQAKDKLHSDHENLSNDHGQTIIVVSRYRFYSCKHIN